MNKEFSFQWDSNQSQTFQYTQLVIYGWRKEQMGSDH